MGVVGTTTGDATGSCSEPLNGSNFLHLLQKHGHQARIDLQEAKRILLEREKRR